MKRGPNIDDHTLAFKKTYTVIKSLEELLQEINKGQYEDFRAYLIQEKMTDLILSFIFLTVLKVDLSHLGHALRGTAVTTLALTGNNIGADGVEKLGIALKGTAVTTLYLASNNIGNDGAEKLGKVLKDTAVTTLHLYMNNIDDIGSATLATLVPDTLLMNVRLKFEHEGLKQALTLNKHRLLVQTPYTALCLTHLPNSEKKKYCNLPALGGNFSKEEEIKFAGGILACLGTEDPVLQAIIVSYLPIMNMERAKALQELAQTRHGRGLQIEDANSHKNMNYMR